MAVYQCPGKLAWPELVGEPAQKAKIVVERENPRVVGVILKVGSYVTHDYRCDRVRLYRNDAGIVVKIPQVG